SFLNSNQNLTVSDSAIVDANFHQKSYQAFFDPARFSIPCSLDITATRYYSFILVLHKLVQAVNSTAGYIPLRLIIQNFLDAGLLSVLCPQWDDTAHACFKEELFKLSADEVLYLDIQPQNQLARMPYTLDMIEKLRALITEISGINTIAGLLSLLAREQPLAPERICTPEELEYTDIRPKLWEAAANFSTAETLGIVQNWSVIFPPAELAEGILRLWLDFIKPIRLSRMLLNPVQPAWEIINLLDSRNRKYVTLAFFNMVENVLPSSPSPVWLLNESQRGLIGLKTYKDIRGWERYYFFRLLLCAQEVQIYTHRNLDKNIEPSSFIGELLEICAQLGHPIPSEKVHYSLPELFRVWRNAPESDSGLNLTTSNICCHERTLSPEFFILPPDPTRDFPASHEIVCNSYSLYMFTKNPFAWYIQNLRKLTPLKAELIETISPTLFGNIMHEYFARILRPHAGIHQDLNALAEVFQDTPFLRKSLEDTLASPAFNCKIPKNYNAEFLSSIISACLVDTLGAFYSGFILKRLKGQRFRLIPEEKRSTIEELTPKQLTTAERDGATYRLSIKGRADLRIETEKHKLIIDFKTGGASVEQLIFYEWFYYLIDAPDSADELESLFWLIFDKTRGKEFTDSKKRAKYYDVIHNSLIQCLEKGYQQGIRAEDRKWLKEITRADLQTVGVEDAKI
ncbi:MAG TPA: PD-(D/E)XK nuclease family protein, partial [Candidatus Cloacimonadota bacterium]|nr:PD-(D/E)XK nuclease family protein [Candidatus Cloacimonadota bacterium]